MLGRNNACALRPALAGSQSGFTLIEIVITMVILGMVGLMVNGVVIRLAQTQMASANVAERLPVVGAAINMARKEIRETSSTPTLTNGAGVLILNNSIALLPRDWLGDGAHKVELKTETPSLTLGQVTLNNLIHSFGDEGQGYGTVPTVPTDLKAASWYEVSLDVLLDPSSGIQKELTFSVGKE